MFFFSHSLTGQEPGSPDVLGLPGRSCRKVIFRALRWEERRIPSGLQPGCGQEQVSPGPSEQLTVSLRPHHLQVHELCAHPIYRHGLLKGALSSFMFDGGGKPLPHHPGVQKGISEEPLAWLVVPRLPLLGVNGAPSGTGSDIRDSSQSILGTYS